MNLLTRRRRACRQCKARFFTSERRQGDPVEAAWQAAAQAQREKEEVQERFAGLVKVMKEAMNGEPTEQELGATSRR